MIEDLDSCENCGRSMCGRFQELSERAECESCEAEVALLSRAGKLRLEGWSLIVVKVDDA